MALSDSLVEEAEKRALHMGVGLIKPWGLLQLSSIVLFLINIKDFLGSSFTKQILLDGIIY